MELHVRIVSNELGPRPPAGTPVRIEVRDVTQQDAASTVVATLDTHVEPNGGTTLVDAALEVADELVASPQVDLTVWARVAASGADRVAAGDLITMQSVPVVAAPAERPIDVGVRPVS